MRRDEIDDDLWCENAEAVAAGHSARSLDADLFLRLLLGMPADIRPAKAETRPPAHGAGGRRAVHTDNVPDGRT